MPSTVFAIGDCHDPWASKRTMAAIYRAIRKKKPKIIIQMGDRYDLFAWSKFPRTHNIYSPEQELKLGRRDAEKFWATIREAAPRAECIQLWGNHDDRALKRTLEKAPELERFVRDGMASIMRFEGVETIADSREVLMIDKVGYHHGYLSAPGAHARANLCSMVVAHTHYGCVIPVKLEHQIIWELNCGYVANRHAVPMSYAQQRRFSRSTLGYGWVDEDGPRFCPLDTEERR